MDGIISVAGFALVVAIGAAVMAALNYFSKGKSFEDVLAEQKLQKEQEDKERSRINKQKREIYKKRFESKKKKGGLENGKMENVSPVHEVQIKSTNAEEKKKKAAKVAKEVKAKKEPTPKVVKEAPKVVEKPPTQKPVAKTTPAPVAKATPAPIAKVTPVTKAPKPIAKNNPKPTNEEKKVKQSKEGMKVVEAPIVVKKVDPEQVKPKKKKSKKQEHPIVEEVRKTELDEVTTNSLLQLLTNQQGGGDWATAGNAGKQQSIEIQRRLEERDEVHAADNREKQRQIKDLTQSLEVEKNRSKSESIKSKEEMSKQQQEINNLNTKLQTYAGELQQMQQLKKQASVGADVQEKLKQYKEENDILKMSIQSNAKEMEEKKNLITRVQTLQVKLQESENATMVAEQKLMNYTGSINQRQAEIESSYSIRIDELTKKTQKVQGEYGVLEASYQKTQNDLELTQSQSAKLLQQVTLLTNENEQKSQLEQQYGSLNEVKKELEDRVMEMDRSDAEKANEVAKLHSQNKDLQRQVGELKTELQKTSVALTQSSNKADQSSEDFQKHAKILEEKESNLAKLRSEIESKNKDLETLESKLKGSDNNLETLKLQMNSKDDDVINLNKEIEKLKKKNNELRERNWKAMDAVSAAETLAKDKIINAKTDTEKLVNVIEAGVKTNLTKSFPHIKCNENNFQTWMNVFLASASEPVVMVNNDLSDVTKVEIKQLETANAELINELNKSKSMTSELEESFKQNKCELSQARSEIEDKLNEVEKYKTAIASTENILFNLQQTVEAADKERAQKENKEIEYLREELKKANQIKEKAESDLQEQINLLKASESECEKIKEEAEKTQSELNESVQKYRELESSCEENKGGNSELCDVASGSDSCHSASPVPVNFDEPKVVEVTEDKDNGFLIIEHSQEKSTSTTPNGTDELNEEVEKLKERLEKEKSLTKNLGAAAGKLKTVLQQTQEQLGKEREKNKELTEQMSKRHSSSSSSSSSGSDLD